MSVETSQAEKQREKQTDKQKPRKKWNRVSKNCGTTKKGVTQV